MMKMNRSYSELVTLKTFEGRFNYLKLDGRVGEQTLGSHRWIGQDFYRSNKWKLLRRDVIIRDNGCDLGVEGYNIYSNLMVHHINPITTEMFYKRDPAIFDMDNLICVSHETHNAIHFGDEGLLPRKDYVERRPFDTCPWKEEEYYEETETDGLYGGFSRPGRDRRAKR